ncbi:hypothetical protein ACET3Z_030112 [Daucus carota]
MVSSTLKFNLFLLLTCTLLFIASLSQSVPSEISPPPGPPPSPCSTMLEGSERRRICEEVILNSEGPPPCRTRLKGSLHPRMVCAEEPHLRVRNRARELSSSEKAGAVHGSHPRSSSHS